MLNNISSAISSATDSVCTLADKFLPPFRDMANAATVGANTLAAATELFNAATVVVKNVGDSTAAAHELVNANAAIVNNLKHTIVALDALAKTAANEHAMHASMKQCATVWTAVGCVIGSCVIIGTLVFVRDRYRTVSKESTVRLLLIPPQ